MLLTELVVLSAISCIAQSTNLPTVIPSPRSVNLDPTSTPFSLNSSDLTLSVDAANAGVRDTDGLTLIPPSLFEFAQTFAEDIEAQFGNNISVVNVTSPPSSGIFFSITNDSRGLALADGKTSSEAYRLSSSQQLLEISGLGARGTFWGSRTALQMALSQDGQVMAGTIADAPDFSTRGIMIDAGRHYYEPRFLSDFCSYLSFFKISEFHLHGSDNLNVGKSNPADIPAFFRFNSDNSTFDGLAAPNESYTKDVYQGVESGCAKQGVTIVPEIEAPGHALVIVEWFNRTRGTDLSISTDPTLLNISKPDTIPLMQSIWDEFLPWFRTKEVSIGADEYDSKLANDYIAFVNDLADHIKDISNKSIRAWGTPEPSNTSSIERSVIIQHWQIGQSDPRLLVDEGYNVINSQDSVQYVVVKSISGYPRNIIFSNVWQFAGQLDVVWNPSLFNPSNSSDNVNKSSPLLKGAIAPAWNDHGQTASTQLEVYYELRDSIGLVSALAWGQNNLTETAFNATYRPLAAKSAPGMRLDRAISSVSETILALDFTQSHIIDTSGNDFNISSTGNVTVSDGQATFPDGSGFTMSLGSKGMNYTLSMQIASFASNATMTFTGPDSSFVLRSSGAPVLISPPISYPVRDANHTEIDLLLSGTNGTNVVFTATETRGTELWVNGEMLGRAETFLVLPQAWTQMAIVAPLAQLQVTGGEVALQEFNLTAVAVSS